MKAKDIVDAPLMLIEDKVYAGLHRIRVSLACGHTTILKLSQQRQSRTRCYDCAAHVPPPAPTEGPQ